MGLRCTWLICILAAAGAAAQGDPFAVSATLAPDPAEGQAQLSVAFRVPAGHHLYADQIKIQAGGGVLLTPVAMPAAKQKYDEFFEKTVGTYERDVTFTYRASGLTNASLLLSVAYQGCGESLCFPPQKKSLLVTPAGATAIESPPAEPAGRGPADAPPLVLPVRDFTIIGRQTGYVAPVDFIKFLDAVEAGKGLTPDPLQAVLNAWGLWITLLLILLGGVALNLTPCVLPMIPINLAIIGAGTESGSRARGFALGGSYGAGMAIVYGLLGLAVVLTGTRFGTLNSLPWFNLAIAALFLLLALGMFGVINLDFSGLQARVGAGPSGGRGRFVTAFVLGGVAALLAGACVAPVLVSVLLLSSALHAQGNVAGWLLPFVLGLGMALPWPFAGAGLSFLPKPGRWMEWVKYGFGAIILVFSLWYGWLGVRLAIDRSEASRRAVAEAQEKSIGERGWLTSLDQALAAAAREKKPIFVDCWASWCKNCLKMEKTTFKDPGVLKRLEPYVRLKLRAEEMDDPSVKPVLDYFDAVGLPTYVVLQPPPAPAGKGNAN